MFCSKLVVNSRFLTQKITGVQRFAIEISLRLKEILKNNVIFVTPDNIIQNEIAQRLDAKVIGKHTGHLWEQFDLPKWLKTNDCPLLLNLCNMAPLIYKNKISTIHDIAFKRYPQTFSKKFLMVYHFMIPRIIASSKYVITVSEFSKSEIVDTYNIDESMVKVVYNAVNGEFYPGKKNNSTGYFLSVSSLNYRKNFVTVLRAFSKFCDSNQHGDLYIVGDLKCDLFQGVDIQSYKNNERIKFLGRVDDDTLIEYYRNAIAFVFPSLYEGFGIPVIEAQACGCPIISSDSSSLPEVLGESALFCDPLDVNRFAELMNLIYTDSDLRTSLITKGYENAKRFSWDESAKKISEFFLEQKYHH